MDTESVDVLKSGRFIKHAKLFIQMIDRALGLLGPEFDMLTEILLELGAKHVRFGVKPEYFPSMGRALIDSIALNLGEEKFTSEIKSDWVEVYSALSYDMIRGQRTVSG
jgi:methyl-accepting chemotaxis protein